MQSDSLLRARRIRSLEKRLLSLTAKSPAPLSSARDPEACQRRLARAESAYLENPTASASRSLRAAAVALQRAQRLNAADGPRQRARDALIVQLRDTLRHAIAQNEMEDARIADALYQTDPGERKRRADYARGRRHALQKLEPEPLRPGEEPSPAYLKGYGSTDSTLALARRYRDPAHRAAIRDAASERERAAVRAALSKDRRRLNPLPLSPTLLAALLPLYSLHASGDLVRTASGYRVRADVLPTPDGRAYWRTADLVAHLTAESLF